MRLRPRSVWRTSWLALERSNADHAIEPAGVAQLREHPIHPVGRLPDVLEEEHGAFEVRCERTPGERGHDAEVAAEQPPLAASGS